MSLNVYLFFNGNCEEAINFYKDATGGTIESMQRYGDAPMPCSDTQKNKIMHGVMDVNGAKVMFSDAPENQDVVFGGNFSLALDFRDAATMQHAFDALSGSGGAVTMPLQDQFWGARFGMCTDKYGVNWMFNMDQPK